MNDIGFDPVKASGDLWSFLNLNVGLTGNGRSKFKQAENLNGLDVWRRIVPPMKPKTVSRKVELHTEVNSPPKCKGISNIIEHLDKWEKDLDEYYLMGDAQILDAELVEIAIKQMPHDTPAHVAMPLHDCKYYDGDGGFKDSLEKLVNFLTEFSGSHNLKINIVDDRDREPVPGPEDGGEEQEELAGEAVDLTTHAPEMQEVILAVMRQTGFRGKVRTGLQKATGTEGAAQRARTPPLTKVAPRDDPRPVRCGNCGG